MSYLDQKRDSLDHNWGKLQLSSSHVRQERSTRVMTLSESVISVMTVGFYTFSAAAAEQPLRPALSGYMVLQGGRYGPSSLYKSHLPCHSPAAKLGRTPCWPSTLRPYTSVATSRSPAKIGRSAYLCPNL